jgi:hypothetical protein
VAYGVTNGDNIGIDTINTITEWPGMRVSSERIPSEVAYQSPGGEVLWGYLIPPKMPRHSLTRLQLDKENLSIDKLLPKYIYYP